jgi:hypothetical protein
MIMIIESHHGHGGLSLQTGPGPADSEAAPGGGLHFKWIGLRVSD